MFEDNPSGVALTQRAFGRSRIASDSAVVEDGQEALDYLVTAGRHAGRDPREPPALVLNEPPPPHEG